MTPERKIAALREARRKIASGEREHICIALLGCGDAPTARALRDYISEQLFPAGCLVNWLEANRPGLPLGELYMRKYRIQWIDWMIRQLETT